jgi:hypothetical protein
VPWSLRLSGILSIGFELTAEMFDLFGVNLAYQPTSPRPVVDQSENGDNGCGYNERPTPNQRHKQRKPGDAAKHQQVPEIVRSPTLLGRRRHHVGRIIGQLIGELRLGWLGLVRDVH